MDTLSRAEFLRLPWDEQKATDFRKVFDPGTEADLTANCIYPTHDDSTASMVIYPNAVYCFGCKMRWWPDQFLRALGSQDLTVDRSHSSKAVAPKYIPTSLVATYQSWLREGYYKDRRQWLLSRGLTATTLANNVIGHTGEAFTIPIFDGTRVVSIRYRRDDELASEDRPKYWGTAGANQAMLYIPFGTVSVRQYGVILCEGELDALLLAQHGYPAVSLTNGCNAIKPEHVQQLRDYARRIGTDRLSVVYDQDRPGQQAAERVATVVGGELLSHRGWWPPNMGKDVTELVQRYGIGEFSRRLEVLWQYA